MLVRVTPDQEQAFLANPSGKFRIAPFLKVVPPIVVLVCLYCYQMAVSKGEVQPFPYCTVTATATPYPQDIAFRTIMTPCTILFILMWFTCKTILQNLATSNELKPIPQRIWWHGWFGSICYGFTMATIDSGKMDDALHGTCAVLFFILYVMNLRLVNIAYTKLKETIPNVITDESLKYKRRVTYLIYLVILYEILRLIFEKAFQGPPSQICIIEWVVVFGFCFYFYSFSWDWKDYYFVLFVGQCARIDKSQNQLLQDQSQSLGENLYMIKTEPIQTNGVVIGQIIYPQFSSVQ